MAPAACLGSGKIKSIYPWRSLGRAKKLRTLLPKYKSNEARWKPLGVIAACVSWNHPFHDFMGPLISILFTDAAIVIKGSESTTWSTQHFGSIVRAALKSCGHLGNLVQLVLH